MLSFQVRSVSVTFSHVPLLRGDVNLGVIGLQVVCKTQVRMDGIATGIHKDREEEKSRD